MTGPSVRQRRPDLYDDRPKPCGRCVRAHMIGGLHFEMLQPVPRLAPALARDGTGDCCPDCQAADTLHDMFHRGLLSPAIRYKAERVRPITPGSDEDEQGGFTWAMARLCVGNCRRDQYRMPGMAMGLAYAGTVQASLHGDLELQWQWLKANGLIPYGY